MKPNDPRNPISYILRFFVKYQVGELYPIRTLIVFDDCAASHLISKRNSELIKMIKTARHLHACVILSAQTIVDSLKELKRIATDLVIWKNVSQSDMEKVSVTFRYLSFKE